jgi:hypothetical protein
MAKKPVVKFNREDAPLPKKFDNGAIGLRAPMPITVKARATAHVNFGISCNHPLLAVGGLVSSDKVVYTPNSIIECTVLNPTYEDIVFDYGSTMLHVVPVLAADYDLE